MNTLSEDPKSARKDQYDITGSCTNCGWTGKQTFLKGVIARETGRECPRCGCSGTLIFSPSQRGSL